ncbi:Synaptobrevin [Hexamita inflata]|uniref:Synaptobrevin n=1 Tax=Hexamita inflata TaxID=28002 RepID=A0AA86NZX3_9EUKA|nr:Synaptobrevin [Hexamita inflata]
MPEVNYACVAYKSTVLAQAGSNQKMESQFAANIDNVLKNFVDKNNMRTCEEKSDMSFAVTVQNEIIYVAFATAGTKRAQLYGLLQDIASEFSQKFPLQTAKFASKLQMQREFGPYLGNGIKNISKFGSNTQQLQSDLEEVKGLVMDNVNAVMRRAQQLDTIENDANELRDNASEFATETDKLKKAMLCKKISMIAGISVAIVAIILIIVLPIVIK